MAGLGCFFGIRHTRHSWGVGRLAQFDHDCVRVGRGDPGDPGDPRRGYFSFSGSAAVLDPARFGSMDESSCRPIQKKRPWVRRRW